MLEEREGASRQRGRGRGVSNGAPSIVFRTRGVEIGSGLYLPGEGWRSRRTTAGTSDRVTHLLGTYDAASPKCFPLAAWRTQLSAKIGNATFKSCPCTLARPLDQVLFT